MEIEGKGRLDDQEQTTKDRERWRGREPKSRHNPCFRDAPRGSASLLESGLPSFLWVPVTGGLGEGLALPHHSPYPHTKEDWITESQRVHLCPTLKAGEWAHGGTPALYQHQDEKPGGLEK